MEKLLVLLLVLCFMHFQPLCALFGFLNVIFDSAFQRPRPVKCNADFTDCHYLKGGTEGVIYIGDKLAARNGKKNTYTNSRSSPSIVKQIVTRVQETVEP